jgi:hypothetical protein
LYWAPFKEGIMKIWEDKCSCGGEYKGIPGAVLTSYPAWYPVECKECGDKSRARSAQEVEDVNRMFKEESESKGTSAQVATLLAPQGVGINTSAFRHDNIMKHAKDYEAGY